MIVSLGTAMESLSSMQAFLSSRPKCFRSLEHAIEWWYVRVCVTYVSCVACVLVLCACVLLLVITQQESNVIVLRIV